MTVNGTHPMTIDGTMGRWFEQGASTTINVLIPRGNWEVGQVACALWLS